MAKKRVLFMCIHNASRSQMAEGFFRNFYGDDFEVYSAGSEPGEIHPLAVRVMEEVGIDISTHTSDSLEDYHGQEFDYVVTVCGNQYNACPFFVGGKKYFKKPFPDPSTFTGSDDEMLEYFSEIRDEIGDWIQDLYKYQICNGSNKSDAEDACCDLTDNLKDCCDLTDNQDCCDLKDDGCCDDDESYSEDCC
jgi:arsenate reductase (thioredoxin)